MKLKTRTWHHSALSIIKYKFFKVREIASEIFWPLTEEWPAMIKNSTKLKFEHPKLDFWGSNQPQPTHRHLELLEEFLLAKSN